MHGHGHHPLLAGGGGGGFRGGGAFIPHGLAGNGNGPRGRAARHLAMMAGFQAAAGPPVVPGMPPPPPPEAEPADLPSGGLIDIPCTAMKIDAPNGQSRGDGRADYEKFVIHQQPEPYSLCAPSEDILLWASRAGQEITVVNTRLQMFTRHHQIKTSPQSVGIPLSPKCVMFTNDYGFLLVISPIDLSFRLVFETEMRIKLNGTILGPAFGPVRATRGRTLAGRATHVLEDGNTIVHLLADPPLALYFRISDILENVKNKKQVISPYQIKDLTGLPSQTAGPRTDPLESAIMMLDDRILLGGPILNTDHLDWAYFDVKRGVAKAERVYSGPDGAPRLHPHYQLKIRLNPLNLREIYVHVLNPYTIDQTKEHKRAQGELWVVGMSTKDSSFQWKRRERPPHVDDANYTQLMQTPMDWTRTPGGILYVRWCDFEGIGPGDEYLCDYRHCRAFTLTRVENTISSLGSMAGRVMQGFEQPPFPLFRWSQFMRKQRQQQHKARANPQLSHADRRRALVTGVCSADDFTRHVSAYFISNTSHVYYRGDQVYDDTEELIERQRKAISQMAEKSPYRSLFGTLFAQVTLKDIPKGAAGSSAMPASPPPQEGSPAKKKKEEVDEEEEEDAAHPALMGAGDHIARQRRPLDLDDLSDSDIDDLVDDVEEGEEEGNGDGWERGGQQRQREDVEADPGEEERARELFLRGMAVDGEPLWRPVESVEDEVRRVVRGGGGLRDEQAMMMAPWDDDMDYMDEDPPAVVAMNAARAQRAAEAAAAAILAAPGDPQVAAAGAAVGVSAEDIRARERAERAQRQRRELEEAAAAAAAQQQRPVGRPANVHPAAVLLAVAAAAVAPQPPPPPAAAVAEDEQPAGLMAAEDDVPLD